MIDSGCDCNKTDAGCYGCKLKFSKFYINRDGKKKKSRLRKRSKRSKRSRKRTLKTLRRSRRLK